MNNHSVVFGRVAPDDIFTIDSGRSAPKRTPVKLVAGPVASGKGFSKLFVDAIKAVPAPAPLNEMDELRKVLEQFAPAALPFVTPQTTTQMPVNAACNSCPTAPGEMPSVSATQNITANQPAPAPEPKKAGFPWWMLVLAGGVAYSLRGGKKPAAGGGLSGVAAKRKRRQSVSMSI